MPPKAGTYGFGQANVVGQVADEPKVTVLDDGSIVVIAWVKFRLPRSRRVAYVEVRFYNNMARAVYEFVTKGSTICVQGRLDSNGTAVLDKRLKMRTWIKVDNWQFLYHEMDTANQRAAHNAKLVKQYRMLAGRQPWDKKRGWEDEEEGEENDDGA